MTDMTFSHYQSPCSYFSVDRMVEIYTVHTKVVCLCQVTRSNLNLITTCCNVLYALQQNPRRTLIILHVFLFYEKGRYLPHSWYFVKINRVIATQKTTFLETSVNSLCSYFRTVYISFLQKSSRYLVHIF